MAGPSQMLGAVLVGGESRRMGTDKANLALSGERLGARAVRTLRSELDEVVVVSRRAGEHADLGADEIADLLPGHGPLAGLHAALTYAGGRPVFVLACDLPRVDRRLVAHLIAAAPHAEVDTTPWAIVPTLGDCRQPLCAIYSGACRPAVEGRLENGRLRMLELTAALDTVWVDLDPTLSFFHPDLLSNVNDRAAAERLTMAGE